MHGWEQKLLERAREIVRHGHGEMKFVVGQTKENVRVVIAAGEAWKFVLAKNTLDHLDKTDVSVVKKN